MGWIHVGGPLDGMDGNTDDVAASIGMEAKFNQDLDEWTITKYEADHCVSSWKYQIYAGEMVCMESVFEEL